MIKKTITYHNFDDEEFTKDFYFFINQTEFGLLNNRIPGGLENYIKTIIENHETAKLLDILVMFITEGYGVKTPEGDWVKEDRYGRKLGKAFVATEACDNLITELLEATSSDGEMVDKSVISFLTGMLPTKVREKVEPEIAQQLTNTQTAALTEVSTK